MQIFLQFWKIYLDTCCLSRLVDDDTQDRILREAGAVETILAYFGTRRWHWIASEVLVTEVNKNPNAEQRAEVQRHLYGVHQIVFVEATERTRGKVLEVLGFKPVDALHLACAESGNADIFLTTDDKLLNAAKRCATALRVRVENPYTWLKEEVDNEHLRNDGSGDL